jgi:DNA-binding IclR family transcriptional regulator
VFAVMLASVRDGWFVAELAERVGLAKRVVANALNDLEMGGVVRRTEMGNRLRYDAVSSDVAGRFAGALPVWCPSWTVILPFLAEGRRLSKTAT